LRGQQEHLLLAQVQQAQQLVALLEQRLVPQELLVLLEPVLALALQLVQPVPQGLELAQLEQELVLVVPTGLLAVLGLLRVVGLLVGHP